MSDYVYQQRGDYEPKKWEKTMKAFWGKKKKVAKKMKVDKLRKAKPKGETWGSFVKR